MALPSRQPSNQRSALWHLSRGLCLFFLSCCFSGIGTFAAWRWMQLIGFAVALFAMCMMFKGQWLFRRILRARYWEWFDEQEARHSAEVAKLHLPKAASKATTPHS